MKKSRTLTPEFIERASRHGNNAAVFAQLGLDIVDEDRTAVQTADVEPSARNEPMAAQETPRFDGQVSVRFHSKRKRLTDTDGACSKYVLDAIVSAGVLRDDNPKCIPQSPSKTQEKSKEETTIVEIYRA